MKQLPEESETKPKFKTSSVFKPIVYAYYYPLLILSIFYILGFIYLGIVSAMYFKPYIVDPVSAAMDKVIYVLTKKYTTDLFTSNN